MLMKFIPLILGFIGGFAAAVMLLRQASSRVSTSHWERKYHELLDRYRHLSERLNDIDPSAASRAHRARRGLERDE